MRFHFSFPLAALAGLMMAGAHADTPLFRMQGFDYTASDLSVELQQALYDLEADYYRRMRTLADNAMLEIHVAEKAKNQGKSPEVMLQALLDVQEPDEATLKAFYEQNKERIRGDYEQLKPQLKRYLQNQSLVDKKQTLIDKIKKERQFKLLVNEPQAPYVEIDSAGFPVRGNPDAEIVLVEFADYQCPHCKRAGEVLDKLLEKHGERIKLVYMDFPINRSGISRVVAEGGVCAEEQGKYWEYHHLAFQTQSKLSKDSPLNLAKQLELDEAAFQTCLDSGKGQAKVDKSFAEARRLGLSSTPAVFLNGKAVKMYEDMEKELTQAIDKLL